MVQGARRLSPRLERRTRWLVERRMYPTLQGVRLQPGVLPDDLAAIAAVLLTELGRRGIVGPPPDGLLRGRFGLARPANRYAGARP